ncbi:MAG: beta-galactosidase [Armatimonadetes bacterium]|nr:beta-galactosidase [Armatimonadota bacterium]
MVKVQIYKGAPYLTVNGRPQVPLSFMGWYAPPQPQESVYIRQVRLAARAGVRHHQFSHEVLWPREGQKSDYTYLDMAFADTIQADPQAMVTLRFSVSPPPWWLEEHPEERTMFDDGSAAEISPSSSLWLKELMPRLKAYVAYIEARWGDRVLAYFPCAEHTGEWFYPGVWTERLADFSPAARSAFRLWLRNRYGSPEALVRAWGRKLASFEEAQIPTVRERLESRLGEFYNPAQDRPKIDYFDFLNDAVADTMERIAAVIKEATGRRKPVMVFYGYLYELAGSVAGLNQSGHLCWSRHLKSRNIDIFASPISYFDRQPGGAGHFMAPVDSVAAHGKLWFNEDDTRTHATPPGTGYGRCETPAESKAVHLRNFAQIFPRRMGTWYMDLGNEGWLNDPALWQNIGLLQKFGQERLQEPARFAPEIAVITDEASPLYLRPRSPVNAALLSNLREPLARIGAPVGWWLLEDFLNGKVRRARLYIFQNAFVLTASQRVRIQSILKRQKATAIWLYAPGYIDPETGRADTAHIGALTGIPVKPLPESLEDVLEPVGNFAQSRGITGLFGSQRRDLKSQWSVEKAEGVDPFAVYTGGGGLVGAAVTEKDGWRSIYFASLYVPAHWLRGIARTAGVRIYCESDDIILGDGRYLSVTASADGEKTIRLPEESVVYDALTGDKLASGRQVGLSLKKGETRLLRLERQ